MQGQGPHEALARDRRRYERLLLARLGGALSTEDAEDIVSEALIRAHLRVASDPPEPGREQAWFARVVLNLGVDFLRARDGRRRNGASPRPAVVPLTQIDEETLGVEREDEAPELEELGAEREREQTKALVERVMAQLDAKDVELIKLRHLVGPSASREQLATMAGLTVGEFRWRYARAWKRFIAAVESDAPSDRCRRIRHLLGEVHAGIAPADASAEIDAHALDCASCKVFARESYRALELMPYAPVLGLTEQWAQRIAVWWERSGPEASAGTAAAGAGIWSLLGGSAAGLFKAVAIVCSATAVTAGVCAGVVAVLNDLPDRPRERREKAERPRERTAAPTPTFVATPAATPTPTRTPDRSNKLRVERRGEQSPNFDSSGESEIPASAPANSSEFNPASGPSTQPDPAPVPVSGGGEFAP